MKNNYVEKIIFPPFKLLIMLVSCGVLIFSSCKKVIDINLNDSDPKIVIEAEISDSSACKVKLTQTVNFDESNTFPPVSGALITINDNLGNTENLTEISSGIYSSSIIKGVPGRTYTLNVTASDKSYSATSSMPPPVILDSIIFQEIGAFGNSSYMANIHFTDPAGIKNYYCFKEVINRMVQKTMFIYADRVEDGGPVSTSLLNNPGQGGDNTEILQGDTVMVLLQCIDKGVYEYFSTLSQSGSGMQSSTPANPKSNFSNSALGYFSAYSVKSKTAIVQ